MLAHTGSVVAPITCSQVIVCSVVTAGTTGGGGISLAALVRNDNEAVGDPGTLSVEVASEVNNCASLTTGFVRVVPGMSAGARVNLGVMVGTPNANSAGTGNGHVSAMLVFIR
ncbi:MAG: hypothetical protein M3Y42_02530 [Actinomycetota bacterium]|nr:hypothetical protein [Actinomycetota bacterium]MDQ2955822.1 hypothetical protein [Actinomycetota bacterium]